MEKKYENQEITFFELFIFKYKNKFYNKKDVQEFNAYFNKWLNSSNSNLIYFLQEKIPNNKYFQDWKKFYVIDRKHLENLEKRFGKKKFFEYCQLFLFWGMNSKLQKLTFEELINYWVPIEKESNGEWDFFNEKDKVEIEISDVSESNGELSRKIQKKYNSNKRQMLSETEIFEKAKKIILKKLKKEPNNNIKINIISFFINCYSKENYVEKSNSVTSFIPALNEDKDGEYMKISKYHEIIKEKSKKGDLNIKNGFISFWYGKSFLNSLGMRIRIYSIRSFYLDYKKHWDLEFNRDFNKNKFDDSSEFNEVISIYTKRKPR